MTKKEIKEFEKAYYPNAERLRKIGIFPFAFNPGMLCKCADGYIVDLCPRLVYIICELIKRVYPETVDDNEMLKTAKKRMKGMVT